MRMRPCSVLVALLAVLSCIGCVSTKYQLARHGSPPAQSLDCQFYYTTVLTIDYHNKHQVLDEFRRRRLVSPLTLAPGETRTVSLLFPMIRSPAALGIPWQSEAGPVQASLSLEFMRELHVPAPRAAGPYIQ